MQECYGVSCSSTMIILSLWEGSLYTTEFLSTPMVISEIKKFPGTRYGEEQAARQLDSQQYQNPVTVL